MRKLFHGNGNDFSAANEAEAWLEQKGYSVGYIQGPAPRGILKGEFEIAKWRNLTHQERKELHGVMTGDQRNGPVTVEIYDGVEVSA